MQLVSPYRGLAANLVSTQLGFLNGHHPNCHIRVRSRSGYMGGMIGPAGDFSAWREIRTPADMDFAPAISVINDVGEPPVGIPPELATVFTEFEIDVLGAHSEHPIVLVAPRWMLIP